MVTDKRIKEIFKEAQAEGVADRNETYDSSSIDIIPVTMEERAKWQEKANDPKYDIYDVEEDWDGE